MTRLLLAIAFCVICLPALADDTDDTPAPCADRPLQLAFYAFFEPVSHSADPDPDSPDFSTHLGYESDLFSALEAMDGAGLTFERRPIALWDEIWLRPATDEVDIAAGGITILDSRRMDADGVEQIAFTDGHITFRQSLLARTEDAERYDSYDKLDSDARAGALVSTTGEFRLLELTGLVDADGALVAGAQVHTPDGIVLADGTDAFVITPAHETPGLALRTGITPPSDDMPQVVYLGAETGEAAMINGLLAGEIDVAARGQQGNFAAAAQSDGALVVSALDDLAERGGMSLDVDDADLLACLNDKLAWLTDGGEIGYGEWVEDPNVFMARAEMWNAADSP